MWARSCELMLGLWLIVSPFVFRHPAGDLTHWAIDLSCGSAVVVIASFAFWPRTGRAHVAHFLVAAFLFGHGWLNAPSPTSSNHIMVALLLALLAVIPSDVLTPPVKWRRFEAERLARDRERAQV